MAFVSRSRRCLASTLRTTSATGASVDTRGYASTTFAVAVDTWTDGTHTVGAEDSDDGSTWATASLDNALAISDAALVEAVVTLRYTGGRRYVRPTITVSGSPATGAAIGIDANLSTAFASPSTATTRCTLDDLDVTTDGDDFLVEAGTISAGDISDADVIAAFSADYPPKTIFGGGGGLTFPTHKVTVEDEAPFTLRIMPEPPSRGGGTPAAFAEAQAGIVARLLSASPLIRLDLRRAVIDYEPSGAPQVAGALIVRAS